LITFTAIFDQLIYPYLRKKNYRFTPIKRITLGFFFASLSMVVAAITQHYIYVTHPCGDHASECDSVSPINVWVQTPAYVLIGISEIFTSITGLEYAFNKAPPNMRSLVTSMWLFTNAISAALGQAFVALTADPLLVVNYGVFAGLSFAGGIAFWFCFRKLDAEEYALNDIRRNEDGTPMHAHGPVVGQAPAPAAATDVEEKRGV
jgi:POT family proton-dependent oligopeptide transporter